VVLIPRFAAAPHFNLPGNNRTGRKSSLDRYALVRAYLGSRLNEGWQFSLALFCLLMLYLSCILEFIRLRKLVLEVLSIYHKLSLSLI
jgi:hypothetical protein